MFPISEVVPSLKSLDLRKVPLIEVTDSRCKKIFVLLLEYKADPNVMGVDHYDNHLSPITCATICGDEEIVALLLENNTDSYFATDCGWAPLSISRYKEFTSISKEFIEYGADPNPPEPTKPRPRKAFSCSIM